MEIKNLKPAIVITFNVLESYISVQPTFSVHFDFRRYYLLLLDRKLENDISEYKQHNIGKGQFWMKIC